MLTAGGRTSGWSSSLHSTLGLGEGAGTVRAGALPGTMDTHCILAAFIRRDAAVLGTHGGQLV